MALFPRVWLDIMAARMAANAWARWLAVFCGVACVWRAGEGRADPFPMSAGHAPQPAETTPVSLERETLSLVIGRSDVQVHAQITLTNTAETPVAVNVGFPCTHARDDHVVGLPCRVKPRVAARGTLVMLTAPRSQLGQDQWTWQMKFAKGESIPLDVRYTTPLVNRRYTIPLAGAGAIYYRLTTGARWRGVIHKLQMDVRVPVETITYVSPPGYVRSLGKISWQLENYEPSADVVIGFSPPETSGYVARIAQKPSSQSPAWIAQLADRWRANGTRIAEEYVRYMQLRGVGPAHGLAALKLDDVQRCVAESARLLDQLGKNRADPAQQPLPVPTSN